MWTKVVGNLANKYSLDTPENHALSDERYAQLVKDTVAAHEHVARDISMRGKPKLELFLQANENMEFKPYLFGPTSFGTSLMFRFRSGNIALNGPMSLTNHAIDPTCPRCGDACESIVHCLIQCPAYDACRSYFMSQLSDVVGERGFQEFLSKRDVDQTVCLLSPRWCVESVQSAVCNLVKQYMCEVWRNRRQHQPPHTPPLATVSRTSPNGSAPTGGAEGYGHLTTPPTP